jgi:signal transduction histidine kinase
LHDNIQQQLAGIHIFLKHYKENPGNNAEVLDDIDRMLGDSISDVRNLSHDLSSLADGKIDLIQKVDDLLLKTERFSGIDFDFSHGLQREIPKFYAVNLYRIIQELVLNTVKHSGAKSSKVSLTESGEQLILIYADDGKGASGADNDGIGMLNIRYRISSLSGIMTLGIFPNGFSMQVNLPLQSLSNSSIE